MLESECAVTERLVVLTLLEGLALVMGVVLTRLVELLQEGQVGGVPRHQAFLVQQCQDTDVRLKTESHTVYLEKHTHSSLGCDLQNNLQQSCQMD